MKKFLKITIGIVIIGSVAYAYRGQLQTMLNRLLVIYRPCTKPIAYKIESFDTKFGISKDYFLSALRDAEAIWEKPIGRELFAYGPDGSLKINLIYDYRQEATAKLQKLGLSVNDDESTYNALKAKYNSLKTALAKDLSVYKTKVADFQTRQKAYEKEVTSWNSRNGAPKDVYDRLNAEREALNAEADELNRLQARINEEIDTINALVVVLNRLVNALNLNVSKYNAVGETLGSEFEEGNYQSGPDGQQIDIYEFNNRTKLVRVLAHEFGHALGLAHVDDPSAIMYRLNDGINGELTAADLSALKVHCGIK